MTVERFLRYVAYPTMSDEQSNTCPSTEKQRTFGQMLCREMTQIGFSDVCMDENGYVSATVPANTTDPFPTLGLIAHLDTSPDAPDSPVHARSVLYQGEPIALDAEAGIYLSARDYPCLDAYLGQHLIVTDGHTLLGADDKAGVAEIVTACERLLHTERPHGRIRICFTPDEEIGRGADRFDVPSFGADYAYTVDGGRIGELEYENFNAASASVSVNGISIHPGDAKDRMKNASTIAIAFDRLLPPDEIPERTEGYEGFHHLTGMHGEIEHATLSYIIRDHDRDKFEEKKRVFADAAAAINRQYGAGTLTLTVKDSYYNMVSVIRDHMHLIRRAEAAMRASGFEPDILPIRGGTDGARLSFMGLPCPNICTGGENYHSRFEFIPQESLLKITDALVFLALGVGNEY